MMANHGTLQWGPNTPATGALIMLNWAILFLVIALVAGVLGFGTIMGTAAWIAKVLFVVFLVLFLVSLLTGAVRRPPA
jgi:uncharacterized membrane protein YtjA (UPF0391 family)